MQFLFLLVWSLVTKKKCPKCNSTRHLNSKVCYFPFSHFRILLFSYNPVGMGNYFSITIKRTLSAKFWPGVVRSFRERLQQMPSVVALLGAVNEIQWMRTKKRKRRSLEATDTKRLLPDLPAPNANFKKIFAWLWSNYCISYRILYVNKLMFQNVQYHIGNFWHWDWKKESKPCRWRREYRQKGIETWALLSSARTSSKYDLSLAA